MYFKNSRTLGKLHKGGLLNNKTFAEGTLSYS